MDLLIRFQPLLILALTAVFALVTWALRQSMVSKTDYERGRSEDRTAVGALDRRVLLLETTVESLPAREELEQLGQELREMGGDMKAFRAELQGFRALFERAERQLSLVHDHLLDRDR